VKAEWWRLRAVGNLQVLKISYPLLIFIPLLTTENELTDFIGLEKWLLATAFFANLFLAIANLIYDIWCPAIIKRFDSPNDLYERMLQIKKLSAGLYPLDRFQASLRHCKDAYAAASVRKPLARWCCTASYVGASALFTVLFLNRAYVVLVSAF
jgi:hypothetical protein